MITAASVIANAQTRERMKLKEMFEDAYERCRTAPMEGVSFTVEDFNEALEKYDFTSEIGAKVSILYLLRSICGFCGCGSYSIDRFRHVCSL